MLATTHFTTAYPPQNPFTAYIPTIPSPLSPRSANIIHGRRAPFFSTSMSEDNAQNNENAVPFSKRPVKKAPSPKQDELKEKRRRMFLRKVGEKRDDKRFEARGEDIMRLDYLQRQRQWEAEQAQSAPAPDDTPSDADEQDDDNDLPMRSQILSQQQEEEEVEAVLQREKEELDALLANMPAEDEQERNLWSDDEDYDALFSELMEQEQMLMQEVAKEEGLGGDEMDMS